MLCVTRDIDLHGDPYQRCTCMLCFSLRSMSRPAAWRAIAACASPLLGRARRCRSSLTPTGASRSPRPAAAPHAAARCRDRGSVPSRCPAAAGAAPATRRGAAQGTQRCSSSKVSDWMCVGNVGSSTGAFHPAAAAAAPAARSCPAQDDDAQTPASLFASRDRMVGRSSGSLKTPPSSHCGNACGRENCCSNMVEGSLLNALVPHAAAELTCAHGIGYHRKPYIMRRRQDSALRQIRFGWQAWCARC